jgi:hypothetical protein
MRYYKLLPVLDIQYYLNTKDFEILYNPVPPFQTNITINGPASVLLINLISQF